MTSTRQHLAHLLKYYPRRPCAPSLLTNLLTASPLAFTASQTKQKHSRTKSRQLRRLFAVLQFTFTYIFTFLKFLVCIHAGASRVPPRVLAFGPKPCEGNKIEKIKCMMSDQNPHPGDIRHSHIPVVCPTPPPPPPPLGLDTDRCITKLHVSVV